MAIYSTTDGGITVILNNRTIVTIADAEVNSVQEQVGAARTANGGFPVEQTNVSPSRYSSAVSRVFVRVQQRQ